MEPAITLLADHQTYELLINYRSRTSLCKIWLCAVFPLFLSNFVMSNSVIKSLPGFPGDLPFKLETGYVGVGESDDIQLFYYFTESERNPYDDPLLLWLTGGPGCSAFSGLVYEIGPLSFDIANSGEELPSLVLNPYSWTKVANIIFLDAPVGTGFSYSTSWEGYYTNDTLSSAHIYIFLRMWLADHPKFLKNPLYVGGDSYSGIVVPIVVQEILNGNEVGHEPRMNLKGYLLGNPMTDNHDDINSRIPYAHRLALVSDEIYESTKRNCNGEYINIDPKNALCANDLQVVSECIENICRSHILEPHCRFLSPKPNIWDQDLAQEKLMDLLLPSQLRKKRCRNHNYIFSYIWASDRTVQNALHIREGTKSQWVRCNQSLSYTKDVPSSVNYHRNFTKHGLRALIYSGDHDMLIPHLGTESWIKSLNLPIINDWRPWFVDGQVAGFKMVYSNKKYSLTFATVKGGGHTAPEYKPEECLAMVHSYIGVGEADEVQLFYYFIESQGRPKDDALMLWLTGGPGCSALSGLLYEVGPFTFDYENSTSSAAAIKLNPFSWTKVANIIFLDSPVGTGFSYGKTSQAYISNDTLASAQIYSFLRKWLVDHPQFLNNQLYIGGDSYSGMIIPVIVQEIYDGNEAGLQPRMNIRGYLIGNPYTNSTGDLNYRVPYAHRVSLLSDELYESTKENCNGNYVEPDPNNSSCVDDLQVVEQCIEKIRTANILEPECETLSPKPNTVLKWDHSNSIEENPRDFLHKLPPLKGQWCREYNYLYSYIWANNKTVQEALHIREGTIKEWVRCNTSLAGYTENLSSSVEYHRNLTTKLSRALIYSGDHDMVIPYMSTQEWIYALNLTVESAWEPWFVDAQVAGYTEKFSHNKYYLTFATVKGAGHTAPEYKPKQCLAMLRRWLAFFPL